MVSASNLRRGQIVTVTFPDSEHREARDARVVKLPPYQDPHDGTVTEKVMVEYPNTTSRMTLMSDLREQIPLDHIEER